MKFLYISNLHKISTITFYTDLNIILMIKIYKSICNLMLFFFCIFLSDLKKKDCVYLI